MLGTVFLEGEDYAQAIPFLNRVRLDGPFSNQALLSAGWASMALEDYERAIVPWSILAEVAMATVITWVAFQAMRGSAKR